MAPVTNIEIIMSCLTDHLSVFTAEARAINLALEYIETTNNKNIYILQIQWHVCKPF